MSKIAREFIAFTRDREPEVLEGEKPGLELPVKEALRIIELPQPEELNIPKYDLTEAIVNRKSMREYSDKPLSLQELTYLLWCTQGVKSIKEGKVTFRTVPSAGCRHALNTYLLVKNVEGLQSGLYRYIAVGHKLAYLADDPDLMNRIADYYVTPQPIKNSAVTFIWTVYGYRMTQRYGSIGMRMLCFDAGHVCQNLYLAALVMGCGVCALGGFKDQEVNALLGLGEEQMAIYTGSVGKQI